MKESPAIAIPITNQHRKQSLMLVRWFLMLCLVAVMSSAVFGQGKFDQKKINPQVEDPTNYKRMIAAAKSFSQSPLSSNKGARLAAYYFTTFVPAKLTQPDAMPEYADLLAEVTKRIAASKRAQQPGANNKQVMGWVYTGMKSVAQGNYHPAGRISAIIYLSKMEVQPENRAAKTPPVYVPNLPTDLLPIYQDPKAADGVRAAALQGLHRFTLLNTPALKNPARATLIGEMKQLLAAGAPKGRDPAAHAYLQRFAVDILNVLRPANDTELGKTLVSISSKTKAHDLIALHSAAAIGDMSAELKGNVGQTGVLLGAWSVRAMRNFQYEIARLNALERPNPVPGQPISPDQIVSTTENAAPSPSGRNMGMSRGMDMDMEDYGEMDYGEMDYGGMGMRRSTGMGMGVMQAMPQPPEVLLSRRKLNHILEQLHQGISGSKKAGVPESPAGVLSAVEEVDKQLVLAWLTKMEEVVTALNDTSLDTREKYIEALDIQVAALQELAGPAAAAEAAAEAPIELPNMSGPVATSAIPDAPVLDKAGGPTFPEGLDELGGE